MTSANGRSGYSLTVARGTSLYVAAVIGPGLLFIPFLAVQLAGPAAIVAWAALLVISVPLVITFSALGVRFPTATGVAAYVRAALGHNAAAAIGACFLAEVLIGVAAIALVGSDYITVLSGWPREEVIPIAVSSMYAAVLAANCGGLRISAGSQLILSSLLVAVLITAIVLIAPARLDRHWSPFAPHGWLAVGSAGNLLIWLFFGWEAMAQLAGEFRGPRDIRRSVALSFAIVTAVYTGLAIVTIVAPSAHGAQAPLADLIGVGFGRAGRDMSIVIAAVLTVGTMNVSTAGAAKLTASLAEEGYIPRRLTDSAGHHDIPRRSLFALAVPTFALMLGGATGLVATGGLVRATSACLISVYLLALTAATKLLEKHLRLAALTALAVIVVVAAFSTIYLLVPASAALVGLGLRHRERRRDERTYAPPQSNSEMSAATSRMTHV